MLVSCGEPAAAAARVPHNARRPVRLRFHTDASLRLFSFWLHPALLACLGWGGSRPAHPHRLQPPTLGHLLQPGRCTDRLGRLADLVDPCLADPRGPPGQRPGGAARGAGGDVAGRAGGAAVDGRAVVAGLVLGRAARGRGAGRVGRCRAVPHRPRAGCLSRVLRRAGGGRPGQQPDRRGAGVPARRGRWPVDRAQRHRRSRGSATCASPTT